MMKKLILMIGIAVASALLGEIAELPLHVPCGQLTEFIKKEDAQRFVDLDKAAATEDDKPAVTAPEELIVERAEISQERFVRRENQGGGSAFADAHARAF